MYYNKRICNTSPDYTKDEDADMNIKRLTALAAGAVIVKHPTKKMI